MTNWPWRVMPEELIIALEDGWLNDMSLADGTDIEDWYPEYEDEDEDG